MKNGHGRTQSFITAVLAACAIAIGCGQPAATTAPVAPSSSHPQARTGGAQLRDKLNAMSVPERIKYLKAHKETISLMNGLSPMGAPRAAPGSVKPRGAAAPK